jgi:tetratricopeptide (TPR) repeat protein
MKTIEKKRSFWKDLLAMLSRKKGENHMLSQKEINQRKISKNVFGSFWIAILLGSIVVIGYGLKFHKPEHYLFFMLCLLALASFVSGLFLGFLFGIPKRDDKAETPYHLSSNLVDISDWLTKIIIGLGLVEIKTIPHALQSVGEYIQQSTNASEPSIKIFSVCCIVYFGVFGIYFGYNYTRLILSLLYKDADDDLLQNQKELIEAGEELQKKNLVIHAGIDSSTKNTLEKYDNLLQKVKTEEEYTFDDWFYRGINAGEHREYPKTIIYMMKALEIALNPENEAKAYTNIGITYHYMGLYETSVDFYSKVIKDYPSFHHLALVYNNLGASQIRLQKFTEAIVSLDQALKLKPDYAIAYYNKACIYSLLRDKEKMVDCLKMAIALDRNLKATALKDTDFNYYSQDSEFKEVLD